MKLDRGDHAIRRRARCEQRPTLLLPADFRPEIEHIAGAFRGPLERFDVGEAAFRLVAVADWFEFGADRPTRYEVDEVRGRQVDELPRREQPDGHRERAAGEGWCGCGGFGHCVQSLSSPSPLAGEGSEQSERVRGKTTRMGDITPHP